jgi:glycosyltransferase involved in cell wall biosynthesis
MKPTITIMIPAYNEEKNLDAAIKNALRAVQIKEISDYEIIIFDDNSKDNTSKIGKDWAKKNKKIRFVHNQTNQGLGYNYMRGLQLAKMEYYTFFPGDNENSLESFRQTLRQVGKADIVIAYTSNQNVRNAHRRLISQVYTRALNFLFGLNLKYYNGTNVYKTEIIKKLNIQNSGFAFNAETLIRLIKRGSSYIEVPAEIKPTTKTSSLKIKNIYRVIKTILTLFLNVRIRKIY